MSLSALSVNMRHFGRNVLSWLVLVHTRVSHVPISVCYVLLSSVPQGCAWSPRLLFCHDPCACSVHVPGAFGSQAFPSC